MRPQGSAALRWELLRVAQTTSGLSELTKVKGSESMRVMHEEVVRRKTVHAKGDGGTEVRSGGVMVKKIIGDPLIP